MSNRRKSQYKPAGHKKVSPVNYEEEFNQEQHHHHHDESFQEFMEIPVVAAVVASNPVQEYGKPNQEEDDYGDFARDFKHKGGPPERKKSFSNPSDQRRNSNAGVPRKNSLPELSREVSLLSSNLPNVKAWPTALKRKITESFKLNVNERKARDFLNRFRWPEGLVQTVLKSCRKLPLRFFIVDDSGSMLTNDGRRLLVQGSTAKLIKCTRWAELTESMLFQAELSECLSCPSEFRLINGADPVIVGLNDDDKGESMKFLRDVLNENPAGPTPLCTHITAVVACIASVEKELRANGQKAVVVIATDGESSDGNVAEALRPLTDLPVLVILRLCTEETEVVEYWNNIDNQLELDIDVIEDQLGDAKQINEVNGWLTYGEPLHRMREFGASMKELDIIDESTLSSDQMRTVCAYLLAGGDIGAIPHPGVEWKNFVGKLRELTSREPKVFCPIAQTMKPWVDIKQLNKFYPTESRAASSSCVMC
mmetsp:Transcript_10092/g.10914  ORF Transcript_10092/g.10914 Transcript_10092/m.10914 type:complete len:481 (-) Transcript_10092:311-1753(-)